MSTSFPTDEHRDGLEDHRLARHPDSPDGLSPEKSGERRTGPSDGRPRTSAKPYTTETEAYRNDAGHSPDHPVDRAEATVPPRR